MAGRNGYSASLKTFLIDKDLIGKEETERGAIPEVLRPIFRDREDFRAGGILSEQTLAALDASASFDSNLLARLGQEPLRQRGSSGYSRFAIPSGP